MKKTLFIILISISFWSYSQTFEEGAYLNDEFGVNIKSSTFINQTTGYSVSQDNFNSVYFYSADSGKNWQAIDTSFNFNANQISYRFGRGIICGSLINKAAIEVFNYDLTSREQFSFLEYSEFIQVSTIDTDTLVFLSKNASEEYFIVKMAFSNDTPTIISSNSISADDLYEIYFSTSDIGWILLQNNLYKTTNCAQSLILEQTQILDFTFYNSTNGAILKGNFPENLRIEHTNDGGLNWTDLSSYSSSSTYGDLIMNSPNSAFVFSMWSGTSGVLYIDFFNFITPENPAFQYSTYYDCSPTIWTGFSFNENQTYFFSACGDILYTLNNCNYTTINRKAIEMSFESYPNPAKDFIEIKLPNTIDPIEIEVCIFNNMGTVVYTKNYNTSTNIKINISHLPESIYFINFKGKGYTHNSSFIKI